VRGREVRITSWKVPRLNPCDQAEGTLKAGRRGAFEHLVAVDDVPLCPFL